VFCENHNIGVLKQAFEEELGFAAPQIYRRQVSELAQLYKDGRAAEIKTRALIVDTPIRSLHESSRMLMASAFFA